MKNSVTISEIMTRHIHTLNREDSLVSARKKLNKYKVRHLPVVDGDKLLGILSLTDIMRMSFGEKFGPSQYAADEEIFEMLTIDQIMKHRPTTVASDDTIAQAAEILTKEEFHALPVVDDNCLVGIVTTTDIIRFLLDN